MEIILGKTAGFCYGVKRAVEGAKNELNNEEKVNCLGEIVHNKQVIKQLEERGMSFIDNINQAENKVIIRAHGVPKDVYIYAQHEQIDVKDYTCPNVLKIHEIVEKYSNNGYYIFLCGSEHHPENIGTVSYCGNNYYVVENEKGVKKALKKFQNSRMNKVLLISQTTYSVEKFIVIRNILEKKLPKNVELIVKNTICKATELRQKETEEISNRVEYMIIIGGKNSSNTRKLYEIAKENCKNSICIETKNELDMIVVNKYKSIGIMAGASTPEESIKDVVNEIKENNLINL